MKITTTPQGVHRDEQQLDPMINIYFTTEKGKQFVIYLRDEGMIIRETSGEALVIHPSGANSILIK